MRRWQARADSRANQVLPTKRPAPQPPSSIIPKDAFSTPASSYLALVARPSCVRLPVVFVCRRRRLCLSVLSSFVRPCVLPFVVVVPSLVCSLFVCHRLTW